MHEEKHPYTRHIFVCTNDRQGQSPSCGDGNSEEIFKELRRIAKEKGVHPQIRVAQAKCLGQCTQGPNIMIYPDQVWLRGVKHEDIEKIVETYFSPESKQIEG